MALQSSGAISISDIKAELGSSSNSLRALSSAAGFSIPDAMSEFYGYAAYTNTQFYRNDGVNDFQQLDSADGSIIFGDTPLTISFWVRQNSSTNKNAQMINFAPGFSSNDRIMIDYNTNSNKLRFNHREGATNTMREYYLPSNSGVTGITGAWTSSTRGNTNSQGFTMLTYVYDPSQPDLQGLEVYWNTSLLTHQAEVRGARGPLPVINMRVGENIHTTSSAGCANMDFDEIKIFTDLLDQNQVTALYNSGTIADNGNGAGIANLFTEITYEGFNGDTAGYFPNVSLNNGGSRINY